MKYRKVKIGFAAPLSGEQSIVAIPMLDAVRLALDEFREEYSPCSISLDLLPLDDQADADKAIEIAHQFCADEDVVAVIGHKNSECVKATGAIYKQAGLTVISPSATGYDLTKQGWGNFYRLCASDSRQGRIAALFAAEDLKSSKVLIVRDETDYGRSLSSQFYKNYSDLLGTECCVIQVLQGSKNFENLFHEVYTFKPEVIYMALTEIESAQIAKEVYKRRLNLILLGADGSKNSKFPELAGAAANGAYMTYAGADPESIPLGVQFLLKYQKAYGLAPVYGAEAYDAMRMVLMVLLNNQQASRHFVAEAFQKVAGYEGASGRITFNDVGERECSPVSIWRVDDNEMKLLKIIE